MNADNLAEQVQIVRQRLAQLRQSAAELPFIAPDIAALATEVENLVSVQEAIASECQHYQHLFEFAPDAYLVTDAGGTIREANRAAAALLEVAPSFLLGKPLETLAGESARSALRSQLESLQRSQEMRHWQTVLLRGNSQPFHASLSVARAGAAAGEPGGWGLSIRDCTECARARQALDESEARFRLLADTAPMMIWMSGTDALCTFFNKPWLDFTGRTLEEELGNGWIETIHPEDLAYCFETYRAAFRDRQPYQMEYRIRRADGEYRWILDNGVPRFAPDGEFAGYLGSCKDISERKLALAALQQKNEQLNAVLNAVPGFISWFDSQGRYLGVNQQLAESCNLSPDAFVGQEIGFRNGSPQLVEFMRQFLGSSDVKASRVIETNVKGSTRKFLIAAQKYQQGSAAVAVGIDITEQARAQEALRQSEANYRAIIHAIPDLIFRLSREGIFLDFQSAGVIQPFIPASLFLGKSMFEVLPSELAGRCSRALAQALSTGEMQTIEYELEIAGEIYYYETRMVACAADEAIAIARDITQRKQAEKALERSEAKFRSLIQNSSDMIALLDGEGRILYTSPASQINLGYRIENSGEINYFDWVNPEDLPRVLQKFRNLLGKSESVISIEYRYRHQNGSWVWLESTATNLLDNPNVGGIVINSRNITLRKITERALRSSYNQIRLIADNLPALIGSVDREQRYRFVNKKYEEYVGLPARQILGQHVQSIMGEPTYQQMQHYIESALAGKTVTFEIAVVFRDGQNPHLLFTLVPSLDEMRAVQGYLMLAQDISDRKQIEEALQASQKMLELVIDNIPQAIFWKDRNSVFLGCNRTVAIQAGLQSTAEIVGKTDYDLSCTKEEADFFRETDRRVMAEDKPEYHIVETLHLADGKQIWLDTSKIPLHDAAGNVTGILGTYEDITERKIAEEALRAQERKFRAIFNNTYQFTGLLTPDGILLEANKTALDFGGLQEEEVLERPFWETRWWSGSPETQGRLREAIALCGRGEFVRYEVDVRGAGDRVATIDFSLKSIFDESGAVTLLIAEGRDITELKRVQKERDRFFNNSLDLMAIADYDGYLRLVNPAWETVLGYAKEEVEGKHFTEFIHPDDVEASRSSAQKQIQSDRPTFAFENRHRCKDGSYRWLSWNTVCFPQEGITYGFARDITDRKQVEKTLQKLNEELERRVQERTNALRGLNRHLLGAIVDRKRAEQERQQSKERFRHLVETTSDLVWEVNEKGVYTYISSKAREILGYEPEEIVGKTLFEMMPEAEAERVAALSATIVAERGVFQYVENIYLHKNGQPIALETSGVPFFDAQGNLLGYRGIHRNISDRKHAEEAIRQIQEQLQAIIDNSPAVIYLLDSQGRYQLVNRSYETLFGISREEIAGKTPYEIAPREIADVFAANNRQVIETGLPLKLEEMVPHADGLHAYFTVLFPLRDLSGVPYAVGGISTDISESKKAQEALSESEERYRLMAENANDLISRHSPDFTYLYVSPACRALLGYEPEELVGHLACEFFHPEDLAAIRERRASCITGDLPRVYTITYRIRRKDGSYIWFETTGKRSFHPDTGEVTGILAVSRDITHRKQAEEALRESERRLRVALEAAQMGTWDWEIPTGKIVWSQKTEEIFGFAPGTFPATLEAFVNCIHPDDRHLLDRAIARAFAEGIPYNIEHRIIWPDGSLRWVQGKGDALRDETGQPSGMSGVVADITDRKLSEEALRDREFKLRTIIDNSNDAIFIKDTEGRYVLINPAGARFFDRPIEEILGKRNEELIDPEISRKIEEEDRRIVAGKLTEIDEQVLEFNGVKRTFLSTKCPYLSPSGELLGMVGIARDITESKLSEQALRESEARYRLMAENSTDMITRHCPEGIYLYASPACRTLLDYEPEELVGRSPYELFHPEDVAAIQKSHADVLELPDISTVSYRIRRKDGDYIWLETTSRTVRDRDTREVLEIVAASRDITDRKRVEIALRESEEKFRRVFENAPIGMTINSINGKGVQVNPVFCNLLGYTEAELQNIPFYNFSHPEDMARELPYIEQCLQGKINSYQMEKRYVKKNGQLVWVNLTAGVIRDRDGNAIYGLDMVEDITERKRVEEALKLRERAIAASSNGIIIADARKPGFPTIYANPAFERITGYSAKEAMGRNCSFLQRRDRQQAELDRLKAAIRDGKGCTVILRNYRKDGSLFWNELSISPISDAEGNLTHFIGIQTDISDRISAQETLRMTQERLKYLLSSSPAVIYACRAFGDFGATFMSENAAAMFGYAAQEFVADSSFWANHIHPEDAPRVFANLSHLFEEGHHVHEYRFQHQDGSYRWVYDQTKLIRDAEGNPQEIIGYWADISDRKQAEEALKTAKEQLQAVLDAVPGFVSWVSSDLRYLGVNQHLANTFGVSPDAFVGQELGFLASSADFANFMQEFFETSTSFATRVTDAQVNGSTRNYLIAAQKYQQGTAAVSVGIDITQRQQIQEQLRASLKEKEVLLKEIHHRVKNNLQIVSSLLNLQSAYIQDEQALAMFKDSHNRVKSMALIHEKLYRSSDLAKIDLPDYIRSLASNLFNSYRLVSSRIDLNLAIDDIVLDIDTAIPCGLIINELISNALKYAFPGETTGRVCISFSQEDGDRFVLKVSDTGVGLPPDFEPLETESLGWQLIVSLTEQLGGELAFSSQNGTEVTIVFSAYK